MAASFGRVGGILGPLLVGYLVAQKVGVTTIFTIFAFLFYRCFGRMDIRKGNQTAGASIRIDK